MAFLSAGLHDGDLVDGRGVAPLLVVLPLLISALLEEFDRLSGLHRLEQSGTRSLQPLVHTGEFDNRPLGESIQAQSGTRLKAGRGQIARGQLRPLIYAFGHDAALALANLPLEAQALGFELADGALPLLLDALALLKNGLEGEDESRHGSTPPLCAGAGPARLHPPEERIA